MNIIKALTDKNLFASLFKEPSRWQAWEVYIRGLFGLPIANKKNLVLFKECTGLEYKPGGRVRESFVIAGWLPRPSA